MKHNKVSVDARKRYLTYKDDEEYKKKRKERLYECFYCRQVVTPTGIGLDRIDNGKGYSVDNVVSCCSSCNIVRNRILTHQETIVAMNAVLAHREQHAY